MNIEYKWQPVTQLVQVSINEPLEFKRELYDWLLSGRRVRVSDTGDWLGVECSMQEWEMYLIFVWGALLQQVYMLDVAELVWLELKKFREFRKLVEREAGFRSAPEFAA